MRLALAAGAAAIGMFVAAAAAQQMSDATTSGEKPYHIENGRVDKATYNGYRRYGDSCLRCHGPDGLGSSYAPNLVESLKHLTQDQFSEIVINGKRDVSTSQQLVMPPFGTVEDVVLYLGDIYAYLKARSDGALGRGRPKRMEN
ncbi:MAG: cytochrome c [Acetobacteraceae bacterium]|nr:c-type cytochrome [Acetobacteraceae bacterium]MDI3306808.1 cytochrome c [Acetobacteraceae bacterium]